MKNTEHGLWVSVPTAGRVLPVLFLSSIVQADERARRMVREAQHQEVNRPIHAADSIRLLMTYLREHLNPGAWTSAESDLLGFLERWALRLEDRHGMRELAKAVEHADLLGPITKPATVGPPLGIRNPGATIRRGGYVPN